MLQKITRENWSKEELLYLVQIKNHIIQFDGFDYIWCIKYTDGIKRHCIIREFDSPNEAWHWVQYNISKWKIQLRKAIKEENKLEYNRVQREQHRLERYKEIANNDSLSVRQKIQKLINLVDNVQINEIARILNVNRKTVQRNIN